MVRVGGGWASLTEFLSKNDPCRGKSLNILVLLKWICVGGSRHKWHQRRLDQRRLVRCGSDISIPNSEMEKIEMKNQNGNYHSGNFDAISNLNRSLQGSLTEYKNLKKKSASVTNLTQPGSPFMRRSTSDKTRFGSETNLNRMKSVSQCSVASCDSVQSEGPSVRRARTRLNRTKNCTANNGCTNGNLSDVLGLKCSVIFSCVLFVVKNFQICCEKFPKTGNEPEMNRK